MMRRSRFKRSTFKEEHQQLKHDYKVKEMERIYDIIMPIKKYYHPATCRDQFLRHLFRELNLPEYEEDEEGTSSDSLFSLSVKPSRFDREVSLSTFINEAPVLIRTTRLMERTPLKEITASVHRLSVLSGRTDHYDELHESMKRSALYFMFARVINRLRIMERISRDWGKIELNSLPHKLFSWSLEEFFKRCMLPDPIYLEVLQLNHTDDSLDWAKFSIDIQEAIRFYKFFYTETYLDRGYKHMLAIVDDQQLLLTIGTKLNENLKTSKKDYNIISQSYKKISDAWWGNHRRKLVKDCKQRSMESTVLLPIQWRYVRDSFATITEMQKLKDSMPVKKMRDQIKELKKQMADDQRSANQAILAYTLLIENYQARIKYFTIKLSTDLTRYDDENLVASVRLVKWVDDYKEIEDKIVFMQRRVREVREELAAERQAQINRIFSSLSNVSRKSISIKGKRSKQAKASKRVTIHA